MRLRTVLLALLSAAQIEATLDGSICITDDCVLAITGILGLGHPTDCKSFLRCTVTPAPTVSTKTATTTVTTTATNSVTVVVTKGVTSLVTRVVTEVDTVTQGFSTATVTSGFQTLRKRAMEGGGLGITIALPGIPGNKPSTTTSKNSVSTVTSSSGAVTNCPSAVPSYASACSIAVRYSSACACFGTATKTYTTVPGSTSTTTTTVTSTSTATVINSVTATVTNVETDTVTNAATVTDVLPAPVTTVTVGAPLPTLCNNSGLQYAHYPNIIQPDGTQQAYDSFDPTVVKNQTPDLQGVTNYLQYNKPSESSAPGPVYGSASSVSSTDFLLSHRGYIFAAETGTYSFTATKVDDITLLWVGPAAYSGWTHANALQQSNYGDPGTNTYTMALQAGNYYPLRIVYWNGPTIATFFYNITSPSGVVLIGSDPGAARSNPLIVQYSCDGTLAPQYPPFGQET